jgi:pyochelin biosynthetic protein PchC
VPGNGEWIRWLHGPPVGDEPVAICFPHAGGMASAMFGLSKHVASRRRAGVVQYPGRQDRRREAPLTDLGAAARCLSGELSALESSRISFYGHSMGAILAFESARIVHDREPARVGALVVSGAAAPSWPGTESFGHLTVDGLRQAAGWDSAIWQDDEMAELFLSLLTQDLHAVTSYQFRRGAPLNCRVLAIAGSQDPLVSVASAAAWEHVTTGPFALEVVDAGHFYRNAAQLQVYDLIDANL